MKDKLIYFWDKYFFVMFFSAVTLLLVTGLWVFIAQPPIACTEIPDELKEFADPVDREKQCFSIYEMDELEAYNEYLAEKYPPPEPIDNYFIDRLNTSSDVNWLND